MDASVSKVSAVRSTNSLFAGHSVAPVLAPYGQVLRKLSRPLRVPINIEIAVRGFATGNQGVARETRENDRIFILTGQNARLRPNGRVGE